ncbi:hypothetical protein HMPREF9332_01941 [Alloprevotella rava F0323]|uniref:Toxin PIN n=1 Tax=Alloprevotella rava F0323 TaxID=679199 RepID=G5GED9_9BACT|nr:hypothetical protein [Alloprevotella rava]EHG20934.1 hypothetical protein HMPREF9332_01941 [Alloprevotella rava F0323]
MKKEYIQPSIKTKSIETGCIIAGSISVGIDDGPATGPALSRQQSDDEQENPSSWNWDE